ncbi:MAG: FAD binding domain-containing protein [Pseudomonadota bacterium]
MELSAYDTLIACTPSGLPGFDLFVPRTVEELRLALQTADQPVAIYAAGTDIFAQFRHGFRPKSLISTKELQLSATIEIGDDALKIDAGATHDMVCKHPALDEIPGLRIAYSMIATTRIRHRGTLGGNLMARNTRYELSILLTALNATADLVSKDEAQSLALTELWDLDPSKPVYLKSVSIPLHGKPSLDYRRDLRPIATQALATGNGGYRLVFATEYHRPWVADFKDPTLGAQHIERLPEDFGNAVAGVDWLRSAGAALLARQFTRLEPAI